MAIDYERRAQPRILPREPVLVEYPTLPPRVRNISLSGAYIEDLRPLPRGRMYEMCIWLDADTSIKVKVMVRHSEEGKGMGVEFLEMARENHNRLRNFIAAQGV